MRNREAVRSMSDAKQFDARPSNDVPKSHLCKGPPMPLPCYCKSARPETPKQELKPIR